MRKRVLLGLVCLTSLAAVAQAAQNDTILRHDHAWARFGKGSWRQVRIVTQNFDEQGNPTDSSITDNKTSVEEVTPERVTLKVEVTVEVAGKRFPSQPQIIKQGYAGETVGQTVSFKSLEPETLSIDGQQVRCETQQVEILGGVTREVSLISFAPGHFPAILKRKSTMRDAAGTKTMQEATTEVKAVGMSRRVLNERLPREAYLVRQEQRSEHGVITTWSWHVPDVPGEIVDQCSKKIDPQGRLVRRTTLELVGYGIKGTAPDDVITDHRRRARRARRRGEH
jgi:hypothetical protein